MATKYKNPTIWTKFGFQVDYDVAIGGFLYFGGHIGFKMATIANQ
jgi:hypothetical protein